MSKRIEMRFTISVDDDTTDKEYIFFRAVDDLMADTVDFIAKKAIVLDIENDEWEEV
jgi:hypothetical protein